MLTVRRRVCYTEKSTEKAEESRGEDGVDLKKWKKPILYTVLILSPFLAGLILWAATGVCPYRLDAYNTRWNDEVGYNRVIRMMRGYLVPQGAAGYNEEAAAHAAYGPYNVFTYIPGFLISFLTGTGSRNFVYYGNLLLLALALAAVLLLMRPDAAACAGMLLLVLLHPVLIRYAWSGMSEMSFVFFFAGIAALTFRMLQDGPGDAPRGRKRSAAIIVVMTLAIALWGLMRPFIFSVMLLPVYLTFRKGSGLKKEKFALAAFIAVLTAVCFNGYFVLDHEYTASYFLSEASGDRFLSLLSGGSPLTILREVLHKNGEAFSVLFTALRKGRWSGVISAVFIAEWLLMGLAAAAPGQKMRRETRICTALLMVIGAAVFESTAVLYNPMQLHRMLLGLTVAYGCWLIRLDTRMSLALGLCFLAGFGLILRGESRLRLTVPVWKSYSISEADRRETEAELAAAMPRGQELWDNTVIRVYSEGRDPLRFLLPDYTVTNICTEDVLSEKLRSGTVRSRYIMLEEDDASNARCAETFEKIWEYDGTVLYRTR